MPGLNVKAPSAAKITAASPAWSPGRRGRCSKPRSSRSRCRAPRGGSGGANHRSNVVWFPGYEDRDEEEEARARTKRRSSPRAVRSLPPIRPIASAARSASTCTSPSTARTRRRRRPAPGTAGSRTPARSRRRLDPFGRALRVDLEEQHEVSFTNSASSGIFVSRDRSALIGDGRDVVRQSLRGARRRSPARRPRACVRADLRRTGELGLRRDGFTARAIARIFRPTAVRRLRASTDDPAHTAKRPRARAASTRRIRPRPRRRQCPAIHALRARAFTARGVATNGHAARTTDAFAVLHRRLVADRTRARPRRCVAHGWHVV